MTRDQIQELLDTLIPAAEAGPIVGVHATNMGRLDDALRPFRIGKQGQRWYVRSVVERYAESHSTEGYSLTLRDLERMLGMHANRVKQLDSKLQPIITDRGAFVERRYHPKLVAKYILQTQDDPDVEAIGTECAPSKRHAPKPVMKVNDAKVRLAERADQAKSEVVGRVVKATRELRRERGGE
jgi:hypothetical protein